MHSFIACTVMYSVMVYDLSGTVGNWIFDGQWRWKRYQMQGVVCEGVAV